MPKMTAAEATKARADLKTAGCPDDVCEQLVKVAPADVIAKIIALLTQYGPVVWAVIQQLLPLLNPTPTA